MILGDQQFPFRDAGTVHVCFDTEQPSINLIPLHKRSRDKHQPGSGNYVNQYVFPSRVSVSGPGIDDTWVLALSDDYEAPSFGSFYRPLYLFRCNGKTVVSSYCYWQSGVWWIRGVVRWYQTKPYSSWGEAQRFRYRWYNFESTVVGEKDDTFPAYSKLRATTEMFYGNSYESAAMLPYSIGSDTSWFRPVSGATSSYVEPRFSPQFEYFVDRIEVGDFTLHVEPAKAAAFVNACDQLPTLSGMNNIANLLDLLGALKGCLLALLGANKLTSFGSIKELLASGWLSYRYVYNTTKADCEEALSVASRIIDLAKSSKIRSNGTYREGDWTVRCSLTLSTKALSGLQEVMKRKTMALGAYNAWDLIPYSFIIDWFLDIGGYLELYENASVYSTIEPESVWFSFEWAGINDAGNREIFYYRTQASAPSLSLISRSTYTPKTSTIVKRGLDVVSMFTR